ncbi:MAG: hypothetical protein GPOALKHO_000246 [Sodalis sp.]|nr:MAG: hypothetical protein GPOALKHO_000246 [Sodalis sp.]
MKKRLTLTEDDLPLCQADGGRCQAAATEPGKTTAAAYESTLLQ